MGDNQCTLFCECRDSRCNNLQNDHKLDPSECLCLECVGWLCFIDEVHMFFLLLYFGQVFPEGPYLKELFSKP